ncbi:MAG: hypothetical protein R6V16_03030 [Bacteroidales bacterium]
MKNLFFYFTALLFIIFSAVGCSDDDEPTISLDNTVWDFLVVYDSNTSWHADVTFNADGSTVYDEPASPGQYTTYGTWELNGNTLTYDMDTSATSDPDDYIFTGTVSGNTMSGTYTFDGQDKNWSATKY